MPLADLNTLINASAQNTSQIKGLSAAYEILLGGVPNIAGFTALINANNASNFGAGPGVTFNDENVYINTMNALYQGNATARANFDAIVAGQASPAAKLTAVYNALIPTAAQSDAGRAFFVAQADFYTARAAELGIAGDNGAALVGAAALAKIAVDNRIDGVGDDIRDLVDAIADGSAQLPETGDNLVPVDQADGTKFDTGETADDAGKNFTLTTGQDMVTGTAQNDTVNGVATGNIATSTLQVSDVIDLGGGMDTINITETGGTNLGAGNMPMLKGVDVVNITAISGATIDFDTNFSPDAMYFNSVGSNSGIDIENMTLNGQKFGLKGINNGSDIEVNLIGGDTGDADEITLNLMGNKSTSFNIDGSAPAASKGGVETINVVSSGGANTVTDIDSDDSAGADVLKTLKITGDQNLTFNSAGGIDIIDGGSVDATGLMAKADLRIDDAGKIDIKTGAMDDRVLLDGIDAGDTVDLGDGMNDIVGIFNTNTAVAAGGMANVKNAEHFEIGGFSSATQDVDNIGAFMSYIIGSTGANASFVDLADGANTKITSNTFGITTLELKNNTVADTLNVELNNGTNNGQLITNLKIDANTNGLVEDVNIMLGSPGGGVGITTNNINARDITVTGGDNFNAGTLLQTVVDFNASAATGNTTVATNAALANVAGVRTGTGNDQVTINAMANGDVTVSTGDGNDVVTIANAEEHNITLGGGNDEVEFDDLATAITTGNAINTATEFATITDFKTGEDKLEIDNSVFGGGLTVATSGPIAAGEYFEATLASTAATDAQVEAAAQAAGIAGGGQDYVAAIQIGSNVHIFFDSDGWNNAGNVSQIAVLTGVDLNGIAASDFNIVA